MRARTTTQQFAAPVFDEGKTTFSDFLNLFVLNTKYNVGRRHQGAGAEGLLPEPGRAEPDRLQRPGGQLPGGRRVPGARRPGRVTNAVTIEWKEFGVRLKFTPTIAGDAIRLKVEPEVSSLDFNNGITLQGFRIPVADHAARRNRRRTARRPVVRDRRPAPQHHAGRRLGGSVPEQHPDHRQPVQEQGGPQGADRADGAHHAAAGAAARARRGAAAAGRIRSGSCPGRGSGRNSRAAAAWWTRRR